MPTRRWTSWSGPKKQTGQEPSSPFRFSVASLRLQDAALLFRDQAHGSVSAVQDINATVSGLSSSGGLSDIVLTGQIGGAPITLSGSCNPFSTPPAAKLAFTAKGVDPPAIPPIRGPIWGYPVVQGRLDLEKRLRHVRLDILSTTTSGWKSPCSAPRTHGPARRTTPVSLGFALLEDLRGNIALDLPISGGSTTPRCRSAGWWARRSAGCSPRS